METNRPLELYIHIPFCVRKCLYCDFLSFTADSEIKKKYVDKLTEEIRACGRRMRITGRGGEVLYPVISVFIGGGTPSTLPHESIVLIMKAVRESFHMAPDAEISIEANPGTVNDEKLLAYRESGINRLSLGLQSANPSQLRALGRIHTWDEFLESFHLARESGFENINVDLMASLPEQDFASYADSLECVALLNPEHISSYSLIIEEGTPFYDCPPRVPDEEEDRRMYHYTKEFLTGKGYRRYEISNYARPGKECRHNCGYWSGTDYLGIGLGASSLVKGERFSVIREMERYLELTKEELQAGFQYENRGRLSKKEKIEEFMFLGLRMTDGISAENFMKRFGANIEKVYGENLGKLMEQGLIEMTGKEASRQYRLTDLGFDVSNYVLAQFLF